MTISATEAAALPIPTDTDVRERVDLLLGRALRRQLWLMFLDTEDRQLPMVMPSEVPVRPRDGDEHGLARFLRQLVDDLEAASVVLVLERPGPEAVRTADRVWARLLVDAARIAEVPLRGPLLLTARGARWLEPDDLDGGAA